MLNSIYTEAQFTDRFWAFGDSAAIDFSNLSNPIPATSVLQARGTCASICDSSGNLLFYAASPEVSHWLAGWGAKGYVIDKNNVDMDSGDSIKTSTWYQEMTIVPDPADINKFYLFHVGVTSTTNPGFYYSKIDLNYNAGLGKVVQKNVQLSPLPFVDEITAVKHGNGRDWWVIGKPWDIQLFYDEFYVYLISPNGISAPNIQHIGSNYDGGGIYKNETQQIRYKIISMHTKQFTGNAGL